MKKIICAAAFLGLSAGAAQAQIAAGTKLLSGSINYSSQKSEDSSTAPNIPSVETKQEQFNFDPKVGVFVAENLALGIDGGILLGTQTGRQYVTSPFGPGYYADVKNEYRRLTGGVFGRYYKFLGEKVALYGELGGGYQNVFTVNRQQSGYSDITNRLEGFYARLLPGITFFPTNKLGLELGLRGASYSRLVDKNDLGSYEIKVTDSTFDFGFGLTDLQVGISFYPGRN